jgi:hypothetical protein
MTVFSHDYTLGFIKEVGEEDVLISINGEDTEVKLTDADREAVLQMASENVFMVPVNASTKELLLNVDDSILREEFPEMDLPELFGAADDMDEEV